ncbi:hypothetical protein HanXRQr2_Chr08g0326491 [Helianthus annuus]|uniref:Uncharacterized protein n=1 Tax=Helianthus annuus TaxID=4232 RepID=A0A9K3ICQ6_HELAN|nr:hypothetical protein HanXRQr2_Chr08g0326491 [Helianthus annuus]
MSFTRSFRLWLCFMILSPFSIVSQGQSPAFSRIIKSKSRFIATGLYKNV